MDSTFSVTVKNEVSIGEGSAEPPCEVCDNCNNFVHNKNDHYLGLCPIDTLNFVEVPGCGEKRWSCEKTKVKNWHAPRDCTNIGETPGECFIPFRHCTNGNCFYRIIFWRGHSDGSTSEAPAGVMNAYADSHIFETPPDDEAEEGEGELVSTPGEPSTTPPTAPAPTPGLQPVNGSSYYAYGGDTYHMELTTSEAYSTVYWYLKPPGDTSTYGNNVETDWGDGSSTTASLSVTLPSDNGGNYRITAYIYYTNRIAEETYDVYVY